MNICVVTHNFPCKAEESVDAGVFVANFAEELSKMGNKVSILCPNIKRTKGEFHHFKVKWFDWAGGDKKLKALRFWNLFDFLKIISLINQGIKELKKLIDSEDIQTCIAMWAVPAGYFVNRLKQTKGIPYSVWVLGSDIWIYAGIPFIRGIIKKVLREAQFLFADSLGLCERVKKISGRECIFMSTTRQLPKEKMFPVELDRSKKNFLFVGRWEEDKGIDLLVRTFIELQKENASFNCILHVFGGGNLEKHIRNMVQEARMQDIIKINDYASAGVVVSYLAVCDCLIIPSRKESIPIVFSEALQMDTPVIVTDVGDMGKLVTEYHVGIVAKKPTVRDLKKAIMVFVQSDCSNFKTNIPMLKSKFSISEVAKQVMECINENKR